MELHELRRLVGCPDFNLDEMSTPGLASISIRRGVSHEEVTEPVHRSQQEGVAWCPLGVS